jgi:predicted nucleic acid-binding protein
LERVLTEPVLIDTGPLVAYWNKRDANSDVVAKVLGRVAPPLFTCWPVLAEAAYLLLKHGGLHLVEQLLNSCGTGFLEILPLDARDARAIAGFLAKYRDQVPDVADAALMHLAERERIGWVLTLDTTDFSIYRTASGTTLRILPEQSQAIGG